MSRDAQFDRLMESFIERQRRGERPCVAEYLSQYPELADEIREVFPALELLEEFASPADRPAPPTPIPSRLGEFRILREIGRGGMGVVYEAVQESLGRHVALKVLPPEARANPAFLGRFRREAMAAARLHHTNIVPVFGVGEDSGVHFYAMQFIPGQTLEAVLRELRRFRCQTGVPPTVALEAGRLSRVSQALLTGQYEVTPAADLDPLTVRSGDDRLSLHPSQCTQGQYFRNVAGLALQAAEALAYAHAQGVVHRDIKPSNLLLDLAGTLWVADFGLAKATGGEDVTATGDVLGTLRYMAPEQLAGKADGRTDVYGLGVTLYELLTLRPAFDDPVRERLVSRILTEELPPPRAAEPSLPRDLETIVLKATAREPGRRYQTAGELADDLRRFLADRPIHARRTSWLEHAWRWCRRNRAVTALTAGVVLLLATLTVGSVLAALNFRAKEGEARAARREAREQLWRSLLNEARARTLTRQPGQRFAALRKLREALALAEEHGLTADDRLAFRNVALAALVLPDVETVRTWKALEGNATGYDAGFDFDGDLRRYVRSDLAGNVTVRRVADDVVLATFAGTGKNAYVYLSPDGDKVAISAPLEKGRRLSIWRLDASGPVCVHEVTGGLAAPVAFSPDSARVAYVRLPEGLHVVDLATGRAVRREAGTARNYWRPFAFSPDGRLVAIVASSAQGRRIRVWDSVTGQHPVSFPVATPVNYVAWHPAGDRLAVACRGRRVVLFDLATRQEAGRFEGHVAEGVWAQFNRSGTRLLSNDWSNHLRVWDAVSGRPLLGLPAQGTVLRVSRDDRGIATQNDAQDGRLRLLRFEAGDELLTVGHRTKEGSWAVGFESVVCSAVDELAAANLLRPQESVAGDGLALLCPRSGRLLAVFDSGAHRPICFGPEGDLWTRNDGGVFRWPRRRDPAGGIRFGPPVRQSARGSMEDSGPSWSGLIPVVQQGALVLIRPGRPDQSIETGFVRLRGSSASPDGRWVAVGYFGVDVRGLNVRVFDAQTGKLAKELPAEGLCQVGFSPDGRWLWAGGGNARTWRVGSWEEGPPLDGHQVAYTPDGSLAATGEAAGVVRLLDPETGSELARLSIPERERLYPHCFSADGSRLFVYAEQSRTTLIWDLRQLREHLRAMRLDWDRPPYAADAAGPAQTAQVQIDER